MKKSAILNDLEQMLGEFSVLLQGEPEYFASSGQPMTTVPLMSTFGYTGCGPCYLP